MNMASRFLAAGVLAVVLWANVAMAQEEAKPHWESIAGSIFAAKGIGGGRYAIGVDRASGQVVVDCGANVLASTDLAGTFTRLGFEAAGPAVAACANSGWSLWVSPDGGRLAAFNSHIGNKACSGCSTDGGKTWQNFPNNWAWGMMGCDSDSLLAMADKSNTVFFSPDAGKTWADLKLTNVGGLGIFGAMELVVSRIDGKINRSDDGGKTWKEVAANYACPGPLQVFKGVGYWLARKGDSKAKEYCLLTSKDKGATWQELCPIASAFSGAPVFGKDEKEIFVATVKGIMGTTDAGASWKVAASYPDFMPESVYGRLTRAGRPVLNGWEQADRHIAYDPAKRVLYPDLPGGW